MDRTLSGGKAGGDRDVSPPPAPVRASPDPMRGLFGAKVRQADEQERNRKLPGSLC